MARAHELARLSEDVEMYLAEQGVDDETLYMARKYFEVWGKPSTHLSGAPVTNWQQLMKHAKGEEDLRIATARLEERELRNTRKKQQLKKSENSGEWVEWHRKCTERKARIEVASAEWRTRVAQRNKWMAESQLYVEEARVALQNAKLEPVPVQPGK